MRQTILLAVLIIAGASLAQGQTSPKSIAYNHGEMEKVAARCTGSYLSLRHESDDAGAGQRAVTFAFTNTSSRPCTLKGYPGFVLLKKNGKPLPGIHVEKSGDPEDLVTLAPHGKAFFSIRYSSCQVGGPEPCRISARVRVTAPNTARAFIRNEQLDPSEGRITLSPVQSTAP